MKFAKVLLQNFYSRISISISSNWCNHNTFKKKDATIWLYFNFNNNTLDQLYLHTFMFKLLYPSLAVWSIHFSISTIAPCPLWSHVIWFLVYNQELYHWIPCSSLRRNINCWFAWPWQLVSIIKLILERYRASVFLLARPICGFTTP